MRRVFRVADEIRRSREFGTTGAELDLLRKPVSGLRSPASGKQRSGILCDLALRRHFPWAEEAVRLWPSFFASGETFAVNEAHLEKARRLLGIGATWRKQAAAVATQGLLKARDQSSNPRPAVTAGRRLS